MTTSHMITAVAAVTLVSLSPAYGFVFRPALNTNTFSASAEVSRTRTCSSGQIGQAQTSAAALPPRERRRGQHRTFMQSAATAEQAHGSVAFIPENEELAAEETVEILYTPPEGLFASVDSLLYCGGFNGWDGEEEAMTLPMMPVDDGRFRVSINVPNFARVLDFVVTDGVRYDNGPDGAFYHAMVTHVREADKQGNIITYRQELDGSLTQTGVIEKVDPQELERMMEEAQAKSSPAAAPAEPMVDDTISSVEQGLRQEVTVTIDEQEAVQKMRAEASVLGERLGLGNMQVNEARDAFDVFDSKSGTLAFEDVGKVLEQLGFDQLDSAAQAELIGTHVLKNRPDATTMTLIEFMYLFKELDEMDVGIDMC